MAKLAKMGRKLVKKRIKPILKLVKKKVNEHLFLQKRARFAVKPAKKCSFLLITEHFLNTGHISTWNLKRRLAFGNDTKINYKRH